MIINALGTQRVMCLKNLATYTIKPNKLKMHLETMNKEYIDKPRELFGEKLRNFEKQKSNFYNCFSTIHAATLDCRIAYTGCS